MAQSENTSKKLSDLGLRLLSAVILGPLVLLITYYGGAPYALLVVVAAVLFLWEWLSITGTSQLSAPSVIGHGAMVAVVVLDYSGLPEAALAVVVLAALAAYAFSGFSRAGRWSAIGVLFSGLSAFALLAVREEGLLFTFFVLLVVWATDIFAYFTGRAIGGPKLWTRVSPKKTWSGAIGGLLLATVCGAGVAYAGEADSLWLWALLAAGLSIVSQGGDLMESAVKRRFSVKDSSRLIPGHGGIMDRIDGLVTAAIFAVLIGLISGGSLADPIAGLGLN
ncbi:phosphatidate cytidylyltransferase [Roseibium salinum]|uniref:Phosphatidate cytidylyltransferase n=1 Tax=Roseibium salinum TaxID=1604349 RepID=A0ABT3R003_9HYPH|nr:phosphatidate cytidylyltransferase [Roseibium sp. DSM 29163]MCX2722550.1 phosphatidate cytidylyltransferase [Roseibium sp. DSM 29163]